MSGRLENVPRAELEMLGSLLYEALFDHELSKEFELARSHAKREAGTHLALVLAFESKAYDLALLPWECMHFPESSYQLHDFLPSDIIMTRQVRRYEKVEELKPSETLRIMIVVCSPVDGAHKLATILSRSSAVEVYTLPQPSVERFTDEINAYRPSVVHLVGHGMSQSERDNYITFSEERDSSTSHHIPVKYFAELLSFGHYQPSLIFLNLAATSEFNRSAALELADRSSSAVVTMQYPLTEDLSLEFAEKFYILLAEGERIDVAFHHARMRLKFPRGSWVSPLSPIAYLPSHSYASLVKSHDLALQAIPPAMDIEKESITCSNCGSAVLPKEKFCRKCGYALQ